MNIGRMQRIEQERAEIMPSNDPQPMIIEEEDILRFAREHFNRHKDNPDMCVDPTQPRFVLAPVHGGQLLFLAIAFSTSRNFKRGSPLTYHLQEMERPSDKECFPDGSFIGALRTSSETLPWSFPL